MPVRVAARPFAVGAIRVLALRDGINDAPNDGGVVGKDVGPPAVAGVLEAAGASTGGLSLGVEALLVEEPSGRC